MDVVTTYPLAATEDSSAIGHFVSERLIAKHEWSVGLISKGGETTHDRVSVELTRTLHHLQSNRRGIIVNSLMSFYTRSQCIMWV